MATLVPDTSALVSLGTVARNTPTPLAILYRRYDVLVPSAVLSELQEIASYDDAHGRAAGYALEFTEGQEAPDVSLDESFPLDDGENAAVSLANDRGASLLLCDEFNQLSLVHASLSETRLVTTPTLLLVFSGRGWLSEERAGSLLGTIADARSWEANSYVERVRERLEQK